MTLRQISNIVYRLKRSHGRLIKLHEPIENTYDVTTGVMARDYRIHVIRRAPVLPTRSLETFTYTLAYIVAAKNFTYGATYNRTRRDVIIDARDLKGSEPQMNWRCEYEDTFYEIEEIRRAEDSRGYILTILRADAEEV